MVEPTRVIGNQEFADDVIFTGLVTLPSGSVDEGTLTAGANIPHTKLTSRMGIRTSVDSTTPVVAETEIIHAAYRDATILGVDAAVYTIADSTGRVVTLDILKSTGGTTGTTIFSAPLTFDSTNATDRTTKAATLSGTPTLANGNLLIRKITVAGSTGAQALGLLTEVTIAQDPTD